MFQLSSSWIKGPFFSVRRPALELDDHLRMVPSGTEALVIGLRSIPRAPIQRHSLTGVRLVWRELGLPERGDLGYHIHNTPISCLHFGGGRWGDLY